MFSAIRKLHSTYRAGMRIQEAYDLASIGLMLYMTRALQNNTELDPYEWSSMALSRLLSTIMTNIVREQEKTDYIGEIDEFIGLLMESDVDFRRVSLMTAHVVPVIAHGKNDRYWGERSLLNPYYRQASAERMTLEPEIYMSEVNVFLNHNELLQEVRALYAKMGH